MILLGGSRSQGRGGVFLAANIPLVPELEYHGCIATEITKMTGGDLVLFRR
jgi:hypothetical protein